jgi:hypothetical protein
MTRAWLRYGVPVRVWAGPGGELVVEELARFVEWDGCGLVSPTGTETLAVLAGLGDGQDGTGVCWD